jgi:hypothetical protein
VKLDQPQTEGTGMAEQTAIKPERDRDEQGTASHTWKRRGLIAAAWAAVAAIVARQTTEPVEAGVDGDVVLGAANTETSVTSITNTTATSIALQLFSNGGFDGWGLDSNASGYGVIGRSNTTATQNGGAGVYGETSRADSYGVWGNTATGVGVLGQSTSGIPIRGQVSAGSSANTIAIYGLNNSSYAGATPGAGGFGVYGLCAKGHGLVGATATAGGAAVVGASNGVAGAYAGAFYGPVVVGGAFTVFGGPKSAAVPHPDGTHRLLYCMESPESWFEDFGKGQLQCGQADVTIDPDFSAVADMEDYHVFLTQYDEHNDLCVTRRSATGFLVKAKDDASGGAFSWRVVAKRKDIVGERQAKVTMPPEPQLPTQSSMDRDPAPPLIRPSAGVRHQRVG